MRYHKTLQARRALAVQGQELSQAERRILILCDGRRPLAEIVRMLGPEAAASLALLAQQGYLTESDASSGAAATSTRDARPGVPGLGGLLQRLASGSGAGPDATAPTATAAASAAATTGHAGTPASPRAQATPAADTHDSPRPAAGNAPRQRRRSLAAAKMYLLDMLQLQRDMQASALAVEIQLSRDDADLALQLFAALDWLRLHCKPSMFQRMLERMQEILPEDWLPALQARLADPATTAPDNVIALRARSEGAA